MCNVCLKQAGTFYVSAFITMGQQKPNSTYFYYLQKRLKPHTNKIIANSVRVTGLRKQRDSATPTAIQKRINPIILHIRLSRHTFLHYILC